MKKKSIYLNIFIAILLVLIFSFTGCKKTVESLSGYKLGWDGDHAYFLKVSGEWDRSTYYVDGERQGNADLGKIPAAGFELRNQSELLAQSRALFAFEDAMQEYFTRTRKDDEELDNKPSPPISSSNSIGTNIIATAVDFSSKPTVFKKFINFKKVYEKVNLKITLIEKYFTDDHDAEIIYLFSAKNLRQELGKAFGLTEEEIELKKDF